MAEQLTQERQELYFNLIEKLLTCSNGEEPEILQSQPELIDESFIRTMLQVATIFAHDGNEDGAQFLFHIARELAKELGLYPDVSAAASNDAATSGN
ncbi:MAG: hypothetical protein KME64_38680 [Scytonematopsis contorta HA4267-MV1]|jgi:hypothetical protein|nr:hypothetical protein [Scytonematopsis contorta HA4267-MV1]